MTTQATIPADAIDAAAVAMLEFAGWNRADDAETFRTDSVRYSHYRKQAVAALEAAGVPALLKRIAELEAIITTTGLPELGSADDVFYQERRRTASERGAIGDEIVALSYADYLAKLAGIQMELKAQSGAGGE